MIWNWIEKWERVGIHGLAREPIHFSILRDRHHKLWDEIILRFPYSNEEAVEVLVIASHILVTYQC